MPAARDYTCKGCHLVFEKFGDAFVEGPECPECGGEGVWTPSFYYASRAAQAFVPVVIHQDASGNVRFPASASAPVPSGFQRVELTTTQQVRAFENRVNRDENEKLAKTDFARRSYMDGQIACNREALEAGVKVHLGGDTKKDPVLMRLGEFSEKGRIFYDSMKDQAAKRRAFTEAKQRGSRSNFFVEAFSNGASNREVHRDAANDWGRSGNRK